MIRFRSVNRFARSSDFPSISIRSIVDRQQAVASQKKNNADLTLKQNPKRFDLPMRRMRLHEEANRFLVGAPRDRFAISQTLPSAFTVERRSLRSSSLATLQPALLTLSLTLSLTLTFRWEASEPRAHTQSGMALRAHGNQCPGWPMEPYAIAANRS